MTPLETDFGRKRKIDQSACNKDYSCVKGFCPSFVTVHGGGLRKQSIKKPKNNFEGLFPVLSEPKPVDLDNAYGIIVTGIGGTGVVTVGAIIGMAAHRREILRWIRYGGSGSKRRAVWSHLQNGS